MPDRDLYWLGPTHETYDTPVDGPGRDPFLPVTTVTVAQHDDNYAALYKTVTTMSPFNAFPPDRAGYHLLLTRRGSGNQDVAVYVQYPGPQTRDRELRAIVERDLASAPRELRATTTINPPS